MNNVDLTNAWRAYVKRSHSLRSSAELLNYSNPFDAGFMLDGSDRLKISEIPSGWKNFHLTGQLLTVSPNLPVHVRSMASEPFDIAVLGWVNDSNSPGDSPEDILLSLSRAVATGRQEELDRSVAWLSGRYIVIVADEDQTVVYGDPMCALSFFWNRSDRGVFAASHSALVSKFAGPFTSDSCRWVMESTEYVSPGGKYLPGTITPFDHVDQLFANCRVTFRAGDAAHCRFFPLDDSVELSRDAAFEMFVAELRSQVAFWLRQTDQSFIGLTAGSDARTVLTSSLDLFMAHDTTAMTYHFFDRNPETTYLDLLGANQLALKASLKFRVLDVKPLQAGSGMAALYKETFPVGARFPTLTSSLYHALPRSSSFFISIGGEIGTGFYRERDEQEISSTLLARKFTPSTFGSNKAVLTEFDRYLEFTQFAAPNLKGFDFYDMFYWEHRLSKWAALGYSEYDLACVPALPMNSRRFLCSMLSLPLSDRFDKYLYNRLALEMSSAGS